MSTSENTDTLKSSLRKNLRIRRRSLAKENLSPNLYQSFKGLPKNVLNVSVISGFAPIGDEIYIWPLLQSLHQDGHRIALPVVIGPEQPLAFRAWTPDCEMETDRYGVSFPAAGETLTPQLILVPLLAFTSRGERLGYGGGYYDRTLAALRLDGEVFACGVAYAGQEVAQLPTDAHDAKLDGILTENGFKAFA